MKMGTISDDQRLEIIEERWGKGQELWGRLKSNADGFLWKMWRELLSESPADVGKLFP